MALIISTANSVPISAAALGVFMTVKLEMGKERGDFGKFLFASVDKKTHKLRQGEAVFKARLFQFNDDVVGGLCGQKPRLLRKKTKPR